MNIVVEGDGEALAKFLREHDYPNWATEWPVSTLKKWAVMVRVMDDEMVVGYVWALWTDLHTLDFHACIAPEYRTRWFSVVPDIEMLATFLGARSLTTNTPGSGRLRTLMTKLLVGRLGYTEQPDGSVSKTIGL